MRSPFLHITQKRVPNPTAHSKKDATLSPEIPTNQRSNAPLKKKEPGRLYRALSHLRDGVIYIVASNNAITDINLIKIFNDGPDVSLNGSPMVSPTTAALCASDPFPP